MAHIVKAALVVATDGEGRHRYLYQGAVVPSDIPAAEVERLADEGFIVAEAVGAEPAEDPDGAPDGAPEPKQPRRGRPA